MATTTAIINIDINTSAAAANLRNLQSQVNAFNSTLQKGNIVQAQAAKGLAAELTGLVSGTRFFTAETVRMKTAAAQLDETLSKGRGSIGQFFSARFNKDGTAAAQVMSLAHERAKALQTQFVATSAAANGFRDAIAIRPLSAFNSETLVANQRLAIHRAMLNQATTSMINFGKNTQWAGRQLMVGFTVPLTIFATTAGRAFADIEKELINFKKVYGDAFTTPEEVQKNLEAVQGLAREYTKYGIAVKDTLALAAQAAAAGAQNAALMDATTEATRLATLGQMEQNKALEATIALQNAFGLSGQNLAKSINFLNMVENQTVVTLQDLADAIPRVAPVIKGLGGTVEDMAAMLAAMQEGGVSAAQGANALKSGLGSLINPTNKAVESLQKMGISLNSIVQANRGDLMGTVQAFGQALSTLDDFSRQQALEEVFGKYQYARLGALFNNIIKDGTQASRVLDLAAMSAEQLAQTAEKELGVIEASSLTKFTAAMERLKASIAPVGEMFMKISTPILNFFAMLFEKLNQLPEFAKKFLAIATVITGVVIPAGTMFLGLLMNLIGTLIKFGNLTGLAFKGFLSGGFRGAIQSVGDALRYTSLAEMDTASAAQQLGISTEFANKALNQQKTAAATTESAILQLSQAYSILIGKMQEVTRLSTQNPAGQSILFGPGAAALDLAQQGGGATKPRPRIRRNMGGTIPGSGNTDTVPAMLTPGEFVVNKQSAAQNLGVLQAINNGGVVQRYNKGGGVATPGRMFYGRVPSKLNPLDLIDMQTVMQQDLAMLAGMGYGSARRGIYSGAMTGPVSVRPIRQLAGRGQVVASKVLSANQAKSLAIAEAERLGVTVPLTTRDTVGFHTTLNQRMKQGGSGGAPPTIQELLDDLNKVSPDPFYVLRKQAGIWNQQNPGQKVNPDVIITKFKELLMSQGSNSVIKDRLARKLYRQAFGLSGKNERQLLAQLAQPYVVDAKVSKGVMLPAVQRAGYTNITPQRHGTKIKTQKAGNLINVSHLDSNGNVIRTETVDVKPNTYLTDDSNPANIYVRDPNGNVVNLRDVSGEVGYSSVQDNPFGYKSLAKGIFPTGTEFAHANSGGLIQYMEGGGKAVDVPRSNIPGYRWYITGRDESAPKELRASVGADEYSQKYRKKLESLLKDAFGEDAWNKLPKHVKDSLLSVDIAHKMKRLGLDKNARKRKLWFEKELFAAFAGENKAFEYMFGQPNSKGPITRLVKEATKSIKDPSLIRYLNKINNGEHPTSQAEIEAFNKIYKTITDFVENPKNAKNPLVQEFKNKATYKNGWFKTLGVIMKEREAGGLGGSRNIPITRTVESFAAQIMKEAAKAEEAAKKIKIRRRNKGGIINGIQHLIGGGPAVGATLRGFLRNRQAQILAREPGVTLESAAQRYADVGFGRLTPAEKTILSQSKEPFVGPQLFRGTGASSPLVDSKLRESLISGRYYDLEGEMIQFPRGSWSTDERVAFDHMRYHSSENQQWGAALDMLTTRGSVPMYGKTYKEFIKREQKNTIRDLRNAQKDLERVRADLTPEQIAKYNDELAQLKVAADEEYARIGFGTRETGTSAEGNFSGSWFTPVRAMNAREREQYEAAKAAREASKPIAQDAYKARKAEIESRLDAPRRLEQKIEDLKNKMRSAKDRRKAAFKQIDDIKAQGGNIQVFFKATKSDRYIPPGEAKISYIDDLTQGDINDPLTTRVYRVNLEMGYPEMIDISGKPFARYGGRTNEYEFVRANKGGLIPQYLNTGGVAYDSTQALSPIVPGVGNTDTVPAMLTPGEFVVNKQATQNNMGLLQAINGGMTPGYATGGEIRKSSNQYGEYWHVMDGAGKKILDPDTGKPLRFNSEQDANNALKQYREKVKARYQELTGKKIGAASNDQLFAGSIKQDRSAESGKFGKWIIQDNDGNEVARGKTRAEAENLLAKYRQENRAGVLSSLKVGLTGKQKAIMLVSMAGIAALSGAIASIFNLNRQNSDEFIGQSNVRVDGVKPSEWTYLNEGGQTDTVPAMLTPGEFVVNKDATAKNLPLLHAINGGTVQGYATGGMVKGLATQMILGTAGFMGGSALGGAMGGDTGSMVGGIAGSMLPMLLPRSLGGIMGGGAGAGMASGMGALLLNPVTGPLAALVAAIVATTYTFYKLSESNQKEFEAGRRLADAMTTSASEIEKLGASARKRAENTDQYLKQEEDDFIEAKYNRKIAKARTEAQKKRLEEEKAVAMKAAGGKTIVSENIDQFYKEQIKQARSNAPVMAGSIDRYQQNPSQSALYNLRNRLLGVRFSKAGPAIQDNGFGQSFIQGAGKEDFESLKAMLDMPRQAATGQLSTAQYQSILQTGRAAYGQNLGIEQITEKDFAAKLSQYILSGVLTQDQASSVAAAIGKEIKNSGFGERIANEVTATVGAEGAFAKYRPGEVAQKLVQQNQRRVNDYQKRIEQTMPQFFAPPAQQTSPFDLINQNALIPSQQRTAEYLKQNPNPTMKDMAKWRETFISSFFSGMADQLKRDMGGYVESSAANIQMIEENISVVQLAYNDMIAKATTLADKERLRYEQAVELAKLEEQRLKAQEEMFMFFGGREGYFKDLQDVTNKNQQSPAGLFSLGLDIFRQRLGESQAKPVDFTRDFTGSLKNVGETILNAFMVGGGNIDEAIVDGFRRAASWGESTGLGIFSQGKTPGEIYGGVVAEQTTKAFEGTQLGINIESLIQLLGDGGLNYSETDINKFLFNIRQLGLQNQAIATNISTMMLGATAAINDANLANGPNAAGQFSLSAPEARTAQNKVNTLMTGFLPGGQALTDAAQVDIATAFPTLGLEGLLKLIDTTSALGDQGDETFARLASVFAQAGDAINQTTASGKTMRDMLLENKQILSDDAYFENYIRGSQHFNQQTESTRQGLMELANKSGDPINFFAKIGDAIQTADPKQFNRNIQNLRTSLSVLMKNTKIPEPNKKDFKYFEDTLNRISKIKDPDIRAKLEADIEPEVMLLQALIAELNDPDITEQRIQIVVDMIVDTQQTIGAQTSAAQQAAKEKKDKKVGGGAPKADPLMEEMRNLRDQINNQEKIGATIQASGEKAFGTFARLRKKLGEATRLGMGEGFIEYMKSLDPKTALEIGKQVLKDQAKLNTLLSLMSQNALSQQAEQAKAAKQKTKFTSTVLNAKPLAGQSMMDMSQAYMDEQFMQGLQQAVTGAKNPNKAAKKYVNDYLAGQAAARAQQALLAPSQLQFAAGQNILNYRGTQSLQTDLGISQEEASMAMQNENIRSLYEKMLRNGQSIKDLSAEEKQSILDFINSQKTMLGEFNKALGNVKQGLQAVNQVLQDSSDFIEIYNIGPLQDQLDSVQNQSANYSEEARRLGQALSDLQDERQEKEKQINEFYDSRFKALDKIARINNQISAQQKGQLDLADALSRGDIAGAAQAQLGMQQEAARAQQEETRAALTSAKEEEIKALENMTINYNGELLTSEQIQSRIKDLNDKIYDNSLKEWDIQQKITAERDKQAKIAEQQAKVERVISVADRLTAAAGADAGQRADELMTAISGARLTNSPEGNQLADYLQNNFANLVSLSPEDFVNAIKGPAAGFFATAGQTLGQDLSGLTSAIQVPTDGTLTQGSQLSDMLNKPIEDLTTSLETWNTEYGKSNPFDKLTKGGIDFLKAIGDKFAKIKEELTGGGAGQPPTKPADIKGTNNEITIPSSVRDTGVGNVVNKGRGQRGIEEVRGARLNNDFEMGRIGGGDFYSGKPYDSTKENLVGKFLDQQQQNRAEQAKKAMEDSVNKILETLPQSKKQLDSLGKNVFDGMINGLVQAKINPSDQGAIVRTIYDTLNTSMQAGSPAKHPLILQLGTNIIQGMWNGMIDWIKKYTGIEFITSLVTTTQTLITNGISQIMALGKSFASNLLSGTVAEMLIPRPQAITNLISSIKTTIEQKIGEIEAIGNTIAQKLKAGFENAMNLIGVDATSITNFINKIKSIFENADFSILGKMLLDKLIQKIKEQGPLGEALVEFFKGNEAAATPPAEPAKQPIDPNAVRDSGPAGGRAAITKSALISPASGEQNALSEQLPQLAKTLLETFGFDGKIFAVLETIKSGMSTFINSYTNAATALQNFVKLAEEYLNSVKTQALTEINKAKNDALNAIRIEGEAQRASVRAAAPATGMFGGYAQKLMFGGMVGYKGSRERAPGMMFGGRMKRYAAGSWVPGTGSTDKIPALLAPGEFVVRKPVAEQYGSLLTQLNDQVYPKNTKMQMPEINANVFPQIDNSSIVMPIAATRNVSYSPMLYNYNVTVNAQTNADANDIANIVMYRIKNSDRQMVRGGRIVG